MAPTIGVNLRVTGHCNQGSRRHMEDMFSVAYQQTEDELDLEYAYFGIFDGHGGHEAATFAKEHLMKAIVSQPGFWSDNDREVLRAIKDGFIATHYAMWRNLENWPKTQSGWPSTSGTTASIAFIRRSNIYIGHVGDSCIVLGYQDPCTNHWRGAPLTRDHKPENPTEFIRISQAGGKVVQKSGVPRVVWHRPRISHKGPLTRSTHIDQIPFLAVARSLGDLWSYNADSDRFVVSPEPDVSVHRIDLTRDRCLIFGTDGLWNMLTPDEAVGIVKKAENNNKNSGIDGQEQPWLNPSKCLVDNALNKWIKFELRADNTSAVTLLLDPLGPPHSQVLDQQNTASKSQSEFVPYHIESYKVNEGKSPSKLHSQSSGLAICTWYPHRTFAENLNKNDGLTTLSTMEELFGKKVEIYDCNKEENPSDECKSDEVQKENDSKTEITVPSTSKTVSSKESDSKKLPPVYSTVLKNPNREGGPVVKPVFECNEKTVKDLKDKEESTSDLTEQGETSENDKDNQEVDENVNKMKLRGSLSHKLSDSKVSNEGSMIKICPKNSLQTRTIKRSCKKGKKRKNYEVIKSQLDDSETKSLRSKSKRRHSSLLETMNFMYEPRPKRRTRSEDQKKVFDSEGYKSDTENKLDSDTNKSRKITKFKSKSFECPETSEETLRQNHLQERLQHNNNSSSNNNNNNGSTNNSNGGNSNNNSNNNNNSSSTTNNNNNNHNNNISNNINNNNINNSSSTSTSNIHDFTPMRLRSNMPVKTLRSRNINLEICDWFLLSLTKINVNSNKRSLSKHNFKSEEPSENNKNFPKMNVLTRSSLNSSKIQVSESPNRTTVHTRSQNKRLKK